MVAVVAAFGAAAALFHLAQRKLGKNRSRSVRHVRAVDVPTLFVGRLKDNITTVRVRRASPNAPDDAAALFRMIELLAKHLNSRNSLRNTPSALAAHFASGKFEALLVETLPALSIEESVPSTIVAAAIFYEAYSTWDGPFLFLEDIFIISDMRKKGIGTLLFKELACLAQRRGYRRFQWESLTSNEIANAWYSGESIAAERKKDIITWRLQENGMKRLQF